jgi:hypothetical protein
MGARRGMGGSVPEVEAAPGWSGLTRSGRGAGAARRACFPRTLSALRPSSRGRCAPTAASTRRRSSASRAAAAAAAAPPLPPAPLPAAAAAAAAAAAGVPNSRECPASARWVLRESWNPGRGHGSGPPLSRQPASSDSCCCVSTATSGIASGTDAGSFPPLSDASDAAVAS